MPRIKNVGALVKKVQKHFGWPYSVARRAIILNVETIDKRLSDQQVVDEDAILAEAIKFCEEQELGPGK